MPLTTPIEGAGEEALVPVVYIGYGGLSVGSASLGEGIEGLEVVGSSRFHGMGSEDVANLSVIRGYEALTVGNGASGEALGADEVISGESFIILADIYDPIADVTDGTQGEYQITAMMFVNGVSKDLYSFNYQAPSGRLGAILSVKPVGLDPDDFPAGCLVEFFLVIQQGVEGTIFALMRNGKLQELEYKIEVKQGSQGKPIDEITFSSIDVMADKFTLSPRNPVIMFDPNRVRFDQVNTKVEDAPREENGHVIMPVIEPVYGLTMKQILQRAYTNIGGFPSVLSGPITGSVWLSQIWTSGTNQLGCGFNKVVTNVPNYPVRRADFTIEAGWHDGAKPVVDMFAPVYFTTSTFDGGENTLYIIDTDRPLPAGMSPKQVTLDMHKMMSQKVEYKPDANAVLLTYQYNGNDPSEDPQRLVREVFITDPDDEVGTLGERGYSKTTSQSLVRQYYMSDAPDTVLDTLPLQVHKETMQTVAWVDDTGAVISLTTAITHSEDTDFLYDGDLKVGYNKVTRGMVADPAVGFRRELIILEVEECTITWTDDPRNVGVKLQDRVITDINGAVFLDSNTETVIDDAGAEQTFNRLYPATLAQESGVVQDSWVLHLGVPLKTIRQTLRQGKGQQYDVEVLEIDHLSGTTSRSSTEPTTGTVSNDQYQTKSRVVRFIDQASVDSIGMRIPVPVNAYELPRAMAYDLARRTLKRFKNPLQTLPLDLPAPVLWIGRGSVIQGQQRDSSFTTNFIVTGYSISGQTLGKTGHRINMSLETTELLAQ